ncbi:MAG: site-specific DNA-methyltransferase [Patescibacteria group bacterium]|nr:site-specific DNA-methyltransferase [Patescibacteria group bacterium]
MTKEQKFFKALQNIFVGAKIEGEGGFINLMRIKSIYYSQIEKLLKEDIDKAIKKHHKFREEMFDKLHSFFNRYFAESGSIYFNSTPFHNDIYEKVYTNEKDVILFWKTQMLYYVKTDRIFRSMPVEFEGYKFFFDAKSIKNKKANEKRTLVFNLKEVRADGTIDFSVEYSEKGKKTKNDEILKVLKKKGVSISEEELEKAFKVFGKQSEVDFFINKNAKDFLQEQFKLWSYQYFWSGAKEWSSKRVDQLQILKDISFKVIDFISQFEDELVKIWNKPKFVKNSNYVITIDKIADKKLVEKILKHAGIKEQINEWQELGIINKKFKVKDINDKKYEHLPIDTKYFKDLEIEILSLFEDLDSQLDGWLIKSENYQALNTILPKFKEKVQTIYIDPPFNLGANADYYYNVNYKDSIWATLLENRLPFVKNWLSKEGSIFVRCDYNGNWIVRLLMDDILINFKNEIAISRGTVPKGETGKMETGYDTLFFYSKENKSLFTHPLVKREEVKWQQMHLPKERTTYELQVRYFNSKPLLPPKGRHWALSQKKINEYLKNNRIRINNGKEYIDLKGDKVAGTPEILQSEHIRANANWTDIPGYSSSWDFQTENAEILLKRVIESTSKKDNLVMDYFLGSGTTIAVAHKLNRKWLGIEMGEHFYGVALPRMKRVLAYDKSGISKTVKEYQGSGFFKYYELEQYEDALANTKYADGDLFNKTSDKAYQDYVFMKDEKMLKAMEIDYKNNKVKIDLSKLYPNIDIAETLSNLTGKWIKKIQDEEVEFTDGSKINTKDIDYKDIKPLIWW